MGILDAQIRTISCNQCEKTVTFNTKEPQKTIEDNPWLNAARVVQALGDGRAFAYCSDECEVAAVATGIHNPIEKKKVVDVAPEGAANAIRLAAEAARQAEEATKAIKGGQPAKLQLVKG